MWDLIPLGTRNRGFRFPYTEADIKLRKKCEKLLTHFTKLCKLCQVCHFMDDFRLKIGPI